ncbi:MAG: hypothetical protein ABSA26_09600 [Thermoguttaceae bacterium]
MVRMERRLVKTGPNNKAAAGTDGHHRAPCVAWSAWSVGRPH